MWEDFYNSTVKKTIVMLFVAYKFLFNVFLNFFKNDLSWDNVICIYIFFSLFTAVNIYKEEISPIWLLTM